MPPLRSRKEAARGRADVDLAVVESSSVVAAIVVAQDGTILGANTRMRRFLGLSDGGARDQRLGDHLVDEAAWAVWCDATRRGSPMEVELRGFDGATKLFQGDVRVEGGGPQRRFVGIFVDGDDSKTLRAAAQHGERMEALGSLTAGVALDIGTVEPAEVIAELLPLLRRALGSRITLDTTLQDRVGAVRANVAQLESVVVNPAMLSMVRWFAESCGGCAVIESVVGQGTTVMLLLPRQQGRAAHVGRGGRSSVRRYLFSSVVSRSSAAVRSRIATSWSSLSDSTTSAK